MGTLHPEGRGAILIPQFHSGYPLLQVEGKNPISFLRRKTSTIAFSLGGSFRHENILPHRARHIHHAVNTMHPSILLRVKCLVLSINLMKNEFIISLSLTAMDQN